MTVRPAWFVLLAYLLAVAGIMTLSLVAAAMLAVLYPDEPAQRVFNSLPGLIAGALASSAALVLTVVSVTRPLDAARLRLRPGRESGTDVAVIILGVLALGQALDSLVALAGLGDRGSMAAIRRAIAGTAGLDLFAAVVCIGVVAGGAEEVFFRGYMQTRLSEHWRPWAAVVVTSFAFAVLHVEVIHAVLAFGLGLYLGFVTERMGSALPAVIAHMVNNTLFTLLTAVVGNEEAHGVTVGLGAAAVVVFGGCVWWLGRRR